MNLQQAETAVLHIVKNTTTTREELEDASIEEVMEAAAEYFNNKFKGRYLAPMFAEDRKFQVDSVLFASELNKFFVGRKRTVNQVELSLDEIIELDETGLVETQLKYQHVIGFCK